MKYPETVKTARRAVWAAIVGGGGSGAATAIMEKGEAVYTEGFGVADRETLRPVDKHTRFDIASLSKIFTTAAVMKLVDLGAVELDRAVCGYVKDFEMADARFRNITVRMLFNHSSGMQGSCYNQSFCLGYEPGYQDFAMSVWKRSYLKHDPGARSIYCNDGFTLAEILIERVSGERYIDFVGKYILRPLGLEDTGESVGVCGTDNVAELYDDRTGKLGPREVSRGVGMGGISSSALDLCAFGQSFCSNGPRILSPESLAVMLAPQPSRFSGLLRTRQEDCHMGWDVNGMEKYERHGVRVLIKGGLTWYASKLIVLPELDVSMALSFAGPGPSTKPALAILDAFLEEKGYGPFKKEVKKMPIPEPYCRDMIRFAGYYTNGGSVYRAAFTSPEQVTFTDIDSGEKISFFHNNSQLNNDYFYDLPAKDLSAIDGGPVPRYFTEADAMKFFVAENEHCADLVYQKIEYLNEPKHLDYDIDGKVWLNVNIDVDQYNWNGMFVVKSFLYKELPGYAHFGGVKKIEDGVYASAAATCFRDQKELVLKMEDGKLTAYVSDYIMRTEDIAAALKEGETNCSVPEEGFAVVWHKTEADYIVEINAEKGAVAQVISPCGKKNIFCTRFQDGEFFTPKGSYIACFGKRGGKVTVKAR